MYAANHPKSVLRNARAEDASALVHIRADYALQHMLMAHPDPKNHSGTNVQETQAWIKRRETSGWFWVIDTGNGSQGFVQISNIHRKNQIGWLGIALLSDARGQGIAKRALQDAQTTSIENGLRKLLLEVRADNVPALGLYNKDSWTHAGCLQAHYDDGTRLHDVHILEKHLI